MASPDRRIEGYIYPKDFFEKNRPRISQGLCFVIMPFQDPLNAVYDEVISKTLLECGLTPVRADKVFDTGPVMISIMQKIGEAEVIIADVTGRNTNVFYELGMAHVVKDKVILITQAIDDVPFDLRHFRVIVYGQDSEGLSMLREDLLQTLTSLGVRRHVRQVAWLDQHALATPPDRSAMPITVHEDRREVSLGDKELRPRITGREFELLLVLYRNRDKAVSHEDIIDWVWRDVPMRDTITRADVSTLVHRLRRRLGEYGQYIVSVPSYGYRFG